MNKEEAINEFLKGLRIILSNALAYPKDHPYFVKSVQTFKQKLDELFILIQPVSLNIEENSIVIDGKKLEKLALYTELASLLHLRKIRSVRFAKGVSTDELVVFLSAVAKPIKEILRSGGMQNILRKAATRNIILEELDYSLLLRGESEEAKDLVVYLFGEAVAQKDKQKIRALTDNFEDISGKFKAGDLSQDDEAHNNIRAFLSYLETTEKDKFQDCTRLLLKSIMRDRSLPEGGKLDKIKDLFSGLSNDDLSQVLFEGISKDESFDSLSFSVFSRLVEQSSHSKIASLLADKVRNDQVLRSNPRIRKKMKELFSGRSGSGVPAFYVHALAKLEDDFLAAEGVYFDRVQLQENYLYILLDLLIEEAEPGKTAQVVTRLTKEFSKIIKDKNWEYLSFLDEIARRRIKEDVVFARIFSGFREELVMAVEKAVLEGQSSEILEKLIDTLPNSSSGIDFYLDNIFNQGRITALGMKLLFKFFPALLPVIYSQIDKRCPDIEFMVKFVRNLDRSEPLIVLDVLRRIFKASNSMIKIEVLRSMQKLPRKDLGFLLSAIESGDLMVRREAMAAIVNDASARSQALESLFSLHSLWGSRNKDLLENMQVIENTYVEGAREYLLRLSRRPFFWNSRLRAKAKEMLKKYHD